MDRDPMLAVRIRVEEDAAAMKLYRMLLTPWVATPRSGRQSFVLVLALVALGAVLAHIFGVAARAWVLDTVLLGIANAACWLLLIPNGLVLALDARRLRLPGIGRDVVWSMPLYAALGIGVPMLCRFPQGHASSFAIVQMLVVIGALLFMVLPYYLAFGSYFFFLFFHRALSHVISIPGPSDPRFVPWGGALAVLLLLIFAWRWRQLLRGDYLERGWRAPSLVNIRRTLGAAQRDPLTDAGSMRVRPDWLLARPDLRGAGPQAPARSLRIALGGVYLPQTLIGRLRQAIPVALSLAFVGLVFSGTFGDHGVLRALHYVFSRDGFVALSWLFAVFSLALVMMPVELLTLRWGRVNAELPLLALLPGLGDASDRKQVLLGVALGRPGRHLLLLLLIGWLGAAALDAGWPVALAMVVVVLGCFSYLCAMALNIFSGRALSSFSKSLLMLGMFVLLSLTVLLPQLWQDWDVSNAARADHALVATWLALAVLLAWLARRGACALRERAHPFLSD
jgi:hypothetical protein